MIDQYQRTLPRPHQSDQQPCFQRGKWGDRGVARNEVFGSTQRKRRICHDVTRRDRQILDPWAIAAVAEIDETQFLAGNDCVERARVVVRDLPIHARDLRLDETHVLCHGGSNAFGNASSR